MPAAAFGLRVYYEDTDLAGIVYHANYLKFIERARTEALVGLGIDQAALKADRGLVFAVRHLAIDFLAPARFLDQLVVTTAAVAVGGARLELAQEVARDGTPLARAMVTLACLGPDGRPVRLPAEVRSALARLGHENRA